MQLLENKIMRIVEERGYMGTKYIPVINEIISYTQNYILNNKFSHKNKWEFFIPVNITDKIDCVEDLQIKMIIEDNYRGGNNSGGGSNDVFLSNTIRNGKLSLGNIKIYGYSYNRQLFKHTVFNSLSHELNHLQEIHKRMLSKDNATTIFKLNKDAYDAINKKFSDDDNLNFYIKTIIYRLMRKSEFNALINGVYGDLDSHNSKRENFKEDINLTQAYSIYEYVRDNIDILNLLNDKEWDNILKSYNMLSANNAKPVVDMQSFKRNFKRKVVQKLNDLIKGIGKIASFYYDKQEIISLNRNDYITIDDPSSYNDF